MNITIQADFGNVPYYISLLEQWASSGHVRGIDRLSNNLARKIREDLKAGNSPSGAPYRPLSKDTLKGPVRRDSDQTVRDSLGRTPLKATGDMADSIVSERKGSTWEIGASDSLNDAKLSSNANGRHYGAPFKGDTPKPVRDPLDLTDRYLDMIEDELVKIITDVVK